MRLFRRKKSVRPIVVIGRLDEIRLTDAGLEALGLVYDDEFAKALAESMRSPVKPRSSWSWLR